MTLLTALTLPAILISDPHPGGMGTPGRARSRAMRAETKKDALKRMSYIEGHFQGIRRMVEEEKYCVDILKQTFAVRRAIETTARPATWTCRQSSWPRR